MGLFEKIKEAVRENRPRIILQKNLDSLLSHGQAADHTVEMLHAQNAALQEQVANLQAELDCIRDDLSKARNDEGRENGIETVEVGEGHTPEAGWEYRTSVRKSPEGWHAMLETFWMGSDIGGGDPCLSGPVATKEDAERVADGLVVGPELETPAIPRTRHSL